MNFSCADCGREYPLDGLDYQCQCGGLFQLKKATGKTVDAEVSLGEIPTPVLRRKLGNTAVHLKLDYLQPTGSFKDFLTNEVRYSSLTKTFPEVADELFERAEKEAKEKIEYYKKLNAME